jgi:hypothetical protein
VSRTTFPCFRRAEFRKSFPRRIPPTFRSDYTNGCRLAVALATLEMYVGPEIVLPAGAGRLVV